MRRAALAERLLVVACVMFAAGCTGASRRPVASSPPGAPDLLATPGGVVWSFHLKDGTYTVLRSADQGRRWRVVQPAQVTGSELGLVASYFLGAQRAWVAEEDPGGATTIYRTTDGARQWRPARVPGAGRLPGPLFEQLGFADARHGWLLAVAADAARDKLRLGAWRTSDGGVTWVQLPSGALPLQGIQLAGYGTTPCPTFAPPHLTLTRSGTGWFSAGGCLHGRADPVVWHTADDGARWVPARLPAPAGGWSHWFVSGEGGTEVGPVSINGTGGAAQLLVPVALGRSEVVVERSLDGGRHWRLAGRADTRAQPARVPPAEEFDPIDARDWVISAAGGLVETADAGRSWNFVRSSVADPEQPLSFTSLDDGYRGGADLVAAQHTGDGGRTWTALPVPATGTARASWTSGGYPVSTIAVVTARTLLAGGADGLLQSLDGGASWVRRLPATSPVQQLDVVDPRTVFAVTDDELLRSVDSGRSWAPVDMPPAGPAYRVQFSSATAGVAVVDGYGPAAVFRTADAGRSWTPVRRPAGWSGSLCFSDADGWAVGRHGVFATDDAGRTWREVLAPPAIPAAVEMLQIDGCSGRTGWVLVLENAGLGGMQHAPNAYDLLYSGDLGRSWTDVLRSGEHLPRPDVATPPGGPTITPAGSQAGLTAISARSAWVTLSEYGQSSPLSRLAVLSTTDAGRHWSAATVPRRLIPPGGWWLATAAPASTEGYVLVGGGKESGESLAYVTADAGRRWSKLAVFDWTR